MTVRTFAAAAFAAALSCAPAGATTIKALGVDGKTMITIDLEKAKVISTLKLKVDQKLLAFDHPGVGKSIYAIDGKARLSTIDPETGKQKLGQKVAVKIDSDTISMDCSGAPAACALASDKQLNAYFVVGGGEEEIANYTRFTYPGGVPARVVGLAQTNAGKEPMAHDAYLVEAMNASLCKQTTFTEIQAEGRIGVPVAAPTAFDILFRKKINTGYMIFEKTLYPVDLASGAAGAGKKIKGLKVDVRDMTFIPD